MTASNFLLLQSSKSFTIICKVNYFQSTLELTFSDFLKVSSFENLNSKPTINFCKFYFKKKLIFHFFNNNHDQRLMIDPLPYK